MNRKERRKEWSFNRRLMRQLTRRAQHDPIFASALAKMREAETKKAEPKT